MTDKVSNWPGTPTDEGDCQAATRRPPALQGGTVSQRGLNLQVKGQHIKLSKPSERLTISA